MTTLHLLLLQFLTLAIHAIEPLPPIRYAISRRGGSFPAPDIANLTYLLEQLQDVEERFDATTRDFSGNKVVRKPKRLHGTQAGTILLGEVAREGNWFAILHIGEPAQEVDMDLDMLTADWWILSTSSNKGSFYLDFHSKSYVDSESHLSFPTCREPKDVVHLPSIQRSTVISFAHCRPSKQWIRALLPSGAYPGLAPSKSLSQTKTVSLMPQLLEGKIINAPIWSLVLLDGNDGLLSIGGTLTQSPEQATSRVGTSDQALMHTEIKREGHVKGRAVANYVFEDKMTSLKWDSLHGAEGWWQILMEGVWAGKTRILQNQPIILDVNTPFIVAPPSAAKDFYSSIAGSRQLPHPYGQFHAYPCFNPPKVHFEFLAQRFEVLKGKHDEGTFSPGGRFSLGRMNSGSGYCIGIVVESRIGDGMSLSGPAGRTSTHSSVGGNGLSDVWIVGEPFFRDVEVVFNWKEEKVAMEKV